MAIFSAGCTEITARPSRRKILNHGKHGTTRKGDPNVFPFLCPSALSVVITCLDNRRAAQRGRTLVEQRSPAVLQRSAAPKTRRQPPDRLPTGGNGRAHRPALLRERI